jgi:hypothetical protein
LPFFLTASDGATARGTFNSQNTRFRQYLNNLITQMAIADPNWNVAHPDERKALDALYWEKAALASDSLQFVRDSKTGL